MVSNSEHNRLCHTNLWTKKRTVVSILFLHPLHSIKQFNKTSKYFRKISIQSDAFANLGHTLAIGITNFLFSRSEPCSSLRNIYMVFEKRLRIISSWLLRSCFMYDIPKGKKYSPVFWVEYYIFCVLSVLFFSIFFAKFNSNLKYNIHAKRTTKHAYETKPTWRILMFIALN